MASEYIEHRKLETGPLLVADSTLQGRTAGGDGSPIRRCWVGTQSGLDGRWLTHAEFRAMVAELAAFADSLPPWTFDVTKPDGVLGTSNDQQEQPR